MSTKHDECSSHEEVCVKLEKAGSLMRGGIGPGRMEGRQLSILADQKKKPKIAHNSLIFLPVYLSCVKHSSPALPLQLNFCQL